MNITFTEKKTYAIESPIKVVEGASIVFACTYWGTVSTPTAVAYRNRATVTSTVFPTNSPSAAGAVVTLSAAAGFVGGARYEIAVAATVGGDKHIKKIELICGRDEDEQ